MGLGSRGWGHLQSFFKALTQGADFSAVAMYRLELSNGIGGAQAALSLHLP